MIIEAKPKFNKLATSTKQQIAMLRERGLEINDLDLASRHLSHSSYYRLSGYWAIFQKVNSDHLFLPNTRFEDVIALMNFDRNLRLLVLDALEHIEISLRTQFANHLSNIYATSHPHLLPDVFKNQAYYKKAIIQLTQEVNRSSEQFIKHFKKNYAENLPPIWASVELMSFGQLSKWLDNIKTRQDKNTICKIYNIDQTVMTSVFQHLTIVRNVAAHHSRLWNREFGVEMILPSHAPTHLLESVYRPQDKHDKKHKRMYNTLVMLGYLMGVVSNSDQWQQRTKALLRTSGKLHSMGFPTDWEARPIWNI